MNALAGKYVGANELVERTQKHGAAADLISQRRDAEINALTRVALGLPIERLVLPVLLEQDHGEQTRPGKAARQHGERCRRLADLLAVPASELLAHSLHDLPLPRHHFEPLGHVLTELGEPVRATAATGPRAGHDHALARQMRRERLARGPSTREGANLRGLAARGLSLLGHNLLLGRRRFELLELKLHLVDEPRLALVARSKQVALELLDH